MNYTPFVIVAQERTGSTWLQMLLHSHENILCYGEIFNADANIRCKAGVPAIEAGADPVEYLQKQIFCERPAAIHAVGFRLFYNHAGETDWPTLRPFLQKQNIRIIHLRRQDLLSRYLSHQLALQTNVWSSQEQVGDEWENSRKVWVNPVDCLADIYRSRWQSHQHDAYFSYNPLLHLGYENLVSQFDTESARLQNFLRVPIRSLSAPLEKQQTRAKSEIIENYTDLKELFASIQTYFNE